LYQNRFYSWLYRFQSQHPLWGVITSSLFLVIWLGIPFFIITDDPFLTAILVLVTFVISCVSLGAYYSWRKRTGTL
jgi:ABC-type transport system involved in cytochrome c biogenesis permease subunit